MTDLVSLSVQVLHYLAQPKSGWAYMTDRVGANEMSAEFDDINLTEIPQIVVSFSVAYSRLNSSLLPWDHLVRGILLRKDLDRILATKAPKVSSSRT